MSYMKNSVKVIIFLVAAITSNAACLFAAMDDSVSADTDIVLDEIILERGRANREYHRYIADKAVVQPAPLFTHAGRDTASTAAGEAVSGKKELATGLVLIVIALLLIVYLNRLHKNKKKE
jgi:hypothetical protein